MSDLVPDGWKQTRLSETSTLITKGATPSTYGYDYTALLSNDGAKFIRGNNATTSGRFSSRDIKYICSEAHKKLKRSQLIIGDVIISIVGSVGTSLSVNEEIVPANINQNVALIRPSKELNSNYLSQVIISSIIQDRIALEATTQAQPSLSLKQVGDFVIPLPPLPEQQKIAAILTSVDDVIEKTQAQIDKLKDLKTGMMQSLLTNGVGIDGKPHTEFKDSPVGRVPKGWKVLPLADVVERIIDCEHKTAPYVEKSEYMVVRTSNVRNGQLVLEDMKFTHADGYAEWTKRAVPSSGDVMFTREAPAGESCLVPDNLNVCLGQRMVLLRPNTEVILPCFFSLFLTSASAVKSIYELSIGTTVSRINIEDIKKIPCVLPSLAEQLKISNSIQSVQILLNAKRSKLKSVNKTKKALMQDLLTGKVCVTVPSETAGH